MYVCMYVCIIKLTHYDETEKRAHDSQIVSAKENLKLGHGGPSYSQAMLQLTDKKARQTRNIYNKKDPQKKHGLGTVSKNIFTGGLKLVLWYQSHP